MKKHELEKFCAEALEKDSGCHSCSSSVSMRARKMGLSIYNFVKRILQLIWAWHLGTRCRRLVLAPLKALIRLFNWASDYDGFIVFVKAIPVLMEAGIIFSPALIYPFLMGNPPPLCYLCYAIWLGIIVGACGLAAVIEYCRNP